MAPPWLGNIKEINRSAWPFQLASQTGSGVQNIYRLSLSERVSTTFEEHFPSEVKDYLCVCNVRACDPLCVCVLEGKSVCWKAD